jgi:hypothetical protein
MQIRTPKQAMVSHPFRQEGYIHTDNQGNSPTLSESGIREGVVQPQQEGAVMVVARATSPITTFNHGEWKNAKRPVDLIPRPLHPPCEEVDYVGGERGARIQYNTLTG